MVASLQKYPSDLHLVSQPWESGLVCVTNRMWCKWWRVTSKACLKASQLCFLVSECTFWGKPIIRPWRHLCRPMERPMWREIEASHKLPVSACRPCEWATLEVDFPQLQMTADPASICLWSHERSWVRTAWPSHF